MINYSLQRLLNSIRFHAFYLQEKRKIEIARKWGDGYFTLDTLPKNNLSQLYRMTKNV